MALKRAQKQVSYTDQMGVVPSQGIAQMSQDEQYIGNRYEENLNKLGATFKQMSQDFDEERMRTEVQKLEYELEDYQTVDDEGNTVTATRVKEFNSPKFLWKSTNRDFEVLQAKKMALDIGNSVRQKSLEITEQVLRDGGSGDDYMLGMAPVIEGIKKSLPPKFVESVIPEIEAEMIGQQAKVQNKFNDIQEEIKLDQVSQIIDANLQHVRSNIIHNPNVVDIAINEINQLPLEGLSGKGKVIRSQFIEELKALKSFTTTTISGVPMTELFKQTNLQGSTIVGKRQLAERLAAMQDMMNGVGDAKIKLNGKEVILKTEDWEKATKNLTPTQLGYIRSYINARVTGNNAGLNDQIDVAMLTESMIRTRSGGHNSPHTNDLFDKAFKKHPEQFVNSLSEIVGQPISPEFSEFSKDPNFWHALAHINHVPKHLNEFVESVVMSSPDEKTITGMLSGLMQFHKSASPVSTQSGVIGVMTTRELLPGASTKVNDRLGRLATVLAISGKLDNDVIRATGDRQREILEGWGAKEADYRKAVRDRIGTKYGDRWFGQEVGMGVQNAIFDYAMSYGMLNSEKSMTATVNSLVDEAYNLMKSRGIVGKSEFAFLDAQVETDWWGNSEVLFPLENYKIYNPDTEEWDTSWHQFAVTQHIKDNGLKKETEKFAGKLELGKNLFVTPINRLKKGGLQMPQNIKYAIVLESRDGQFDLLRANNGEMLIYSPEQYWEVLDKEQQIDNHDMELLKSRMLHATHRGNTQEEERLLRLQEGVESTYRETLDALLPGYLK